MGSEWAQEADRQAKMITRDLAEVGLSRGYRVEYQRREARFALRAGGETYYFSAHDYPARGGVDWLGLRVAVLTAAGARVRRPASPADARESNDEETNGEAVSHGQGDT
jgi:hypothetical protein